jgi:gliding motility-associated-like protein
MKLYHSIDYDCGATVRFQNHTDQSAGMDSFTWYVTREDGSIDTLDGFEPSLTYTKSGDYFYKVLGLSQEEREYGEWFIDTLKIRIPQKPVAAFTAADTLICAYAPLEFINESSTDTIHPTNGEKWVWTFGDGETETVTRPFDSAQDDSPPAVTHVYTMPGTYSVSLFYSNGFCDSTLIQNQYIKVVDAPAPGFSTDNHRGCSPFTVTITDTISKNTNKKEYNYYDGRGWVDVPVNQETFSQTYTDAGEYWVTQRLYGYTGCVTQLDSQRIYVTAGFMETDTSHITNATFQDVPARPKLNEVITVNWPCLEEEAVRYELYRNNQKIAVLDAQPCQYGQMWYADSLDQPSSSLLTYTVWAIDSCGTAAQVGRVGQPVYVTGEVIGKNELSVIRYTAYQDWNAGESELSYEIQTTDELGNWKTIHQQITATSYNDYAFLGRGLQRGTSSSLGTTQLEKCYRVVAELGSAKSSISNVLCLPFSPIVFIPTAFTPDANGLNDVWRPVTFGIEHYEVTIYNRYGQQIRYFTESEEGWAALDVPAGAYMVIIRAKGTDNEWYSLKSTVTVLR